VNVMTGDEWNKILNNVLERASNDRRELFFYLMVSVIWNAILTLVLAYMVWK
jgi:hypothetical protein